MYGTNCGKAEEAVWNNYPQEAPEGAARWNSQVTIFPGCPKWPSDSLWETAWRNYELTMGQSVHLNPIHPLEVYKIEG